MLAKYVVTTVMLLNFLSPVLANEPELDPLLFKRKEAVFQMVDKLRKSKGLGIDKLQRLTARNLFYTNGGSYQSEIEQDKDITSYELPCDRKRKIQYIELSVNKNLSIGIEDVRKRYGKWEKTSQSKGNSEEKILSEYRYYYYKNSLAFNFRSKKHERLTSIIVYFVP